MRFKSFLLFFVVIVGLSAGSCQSAPAGNELKPESFKQKMDGMSNEILLDVRTPEEYNGGHLNGALNIDWNGDAFEAEVGKLDKSKPVFVYCLAGTRSAAAAKSMRNMGFKEVYELQGGIMKWRAAGLPESNTGTKPAGMSTKDFEALLNTEKIVLVDFYATWCGPCKKMEPYLAEIKKENANVNVIRIDADENAMLAAELKVNALPTIFIYKNQQLTWHHVGYIGKDELVRKITETSAAKETK